MDIRSRKTRKAAKRRAAEYLNDVEKNQLAIRAIMAKRKVHPDARQNALRVVEQAIGGKLISSRRRSS
jgi:hypothetical protein